MCSAQLEPLMKPLIITLLTRMSANKTDKYTYLLSFFWLYTMAIQVDGLSPDFVIRAHDSVQPGFVEHSALHIHSLMGVSGCGRRSS
jgi:hypothetical protein